MKELFESLDKEIFSAELVESLETEFNKSVNENVEAKVLIAEAEMKDKLITENALVLEAKTEELVVEAEEKFVALKEEVGSKLNDYLTLVVEEFVQDNEIALVSEEESAKVQALIEGFSSFVISTGIDVAVISEGKDNSDAEIKLAEQVEVNNALVEENLAMKSKNQMFLQMGLINEMKEGLSLVESEKFERLSGLVEFSEEVGYATKLETLKESIKGAKEEGHLDALDESKKEVNAPAKCSFTHLM